MIISIMVATRHWPDEYSVENNFDLLWWPPRKFDLSRRFIYWQNERCLLLGSVHLENLKANQRQLIIPSYNSYEICYIARYIRTIRCDNSFHLQINDNWVLHVCFSAKIEPNIIWKKYQILMTYQNRKKVSGLWRFF